MENSQPLATESFSYSWLLDKKPPFDHGLVEPRRPSIDDSIESSAIKLKHKDMDVPSNRSFHQEVAAHENFNFDVPFSESSVNVLVHADEIFSDGYMMPVYLDRSNILQASTSLPATPISSFSSMAAVSSANKKTSAGQSNVIKKWMKSSNRILQKCSGFLVPTCQSLRCSRKGVKVDDLGRKYWEVRSWSNSPQASPRQSVAHSAVDWAEMEQARGRFDVHCSLRKVKSVSSSTQASPVRRSPAPDVNFDAECPIYEAILHCKRSIEKRED